jgi:L-lactate dehydrogenase complex protein LldF
MDTFHRRIRTAIHDQNLQAALDANAERRVNGRLAAFASLPDWPQRRQLAHAVRADVIENLESYLEEFVAHAQQHGIVVHRAGDASEALAAILKIAGQTPAGVQGRPVLFAKSKSMVSEEIGLNHALEAAGHRVVETDLGEYIVQLRGEKPAHIITPAVHLRRADVGKLFAEKLGIPYTEDIPTLTNTARRVLREVFLTAGIGLSGVNFGVVSTGGLCTITNEGNGRMVTTLPRTHIALMGIERLVRDFDDLALMLSLLPRSATGQKITVYTQIIHAPLEGQERHLVLLDNGRRRLRDSSLKESLYCIRCGACLNACPVFREIGGHAYGSVYPGPIGSVISGGLFGPEYAPLAQASSLCGACMEACPVDIDLPKLLTRVRAGKGPVSGNSSQGVSPGQGLTPALKLGLGLYARLASSPGLFALSQKLAAIGTRLVSPFSNMLRLPAFTGWGYSKDFPRFAARPFHERFREQDTQLTAAEKTILSQPPGGTEAARPIQQIEDPAERFAEELAALGGHVLRVNNPTATVKAFLRSRGVDCVHMEPGVLDEAVLEHAGIHVTHTPDPQIRVGITGAFCAVAETGSILVKNGEGSPLQASLLPEIHIAILRLSDIVPSLADALPLVHGSASAVFITGPSRTADIEMTLTIGVHGPGELHVFLVDDRHPGEA